MVLHLGSEAPSVPLSVRNITIRPQARWSENIRSRASCSSLRAIAELLPGQSLGADHHGNSRADEEDLHGASARVGTTMKAGNQTGHCDVQEAGGRESQHIREGAHRLTQTEVSH